MKYENQPISYCMEAGGYKAVIALTIQRLYLFRGASKFKLHSTVIHWGIKFTSRLIERWTKIKTMFNNISIYKTRPNTIKPITTQYNTLQFNTTHCNSTQHIEIQHNTLQFNTTHCNSTQHIATQFNYLFYNLTVSCATNWFQSKSNSKIQHITMEYILYVNRYDTYQTKIIQGMKLNTRPPQYTCNALHRSGTLRKIMKHFSTKSNAPPHRVTLRNTVQHNAT